MIHCNWCGADFDESVDLWGHAACLECKSVGYLIVRNAPPQEPIFTYADPISQVEERLEMEADRELMRDEFHVR